MATKKIVDCQTGEVELTSISNEEMDRRAQESQLNEIQIMRNYRNSLLVASDWTQLPDVSLLEEVAVKWAIYRQQLRDITDDPNWPNVDWPSQPS